MLIWLSHAVALIFGVTMGVLLMSQLQINHSLRQRRGIGNYPDLRGPAE